jgi:hypothetical protein
MSVKFLARQYVEPKWYPVELGPDATIEIALARPTLEEQLKAIGETDSYRGYSLLSAIKDWRGVVDENDQPVPYSWAALNQLCTAYPDAVVQFLSVHRTALEGLTETERKNLSSPPGNGGEAAASETTATIQSSDSGAVSSD